MSEPENDSTGARVFRCEHCKKILYRSSFGRILAPEGDEEKLSFSRAPISFTIGQTFMFDSKACLLSWIEAQPDDSLRRGYPLW